MYGLRLGFGTCYGVKIGTTISEGDDLSDLRFLFTLFPLPFENQDLCWSYGYSCSKKVVTEQVGTSSDCLSGLVVLTDIGTNCYLFGLG